MGRQRSTAQQLAAQARPAAAGLNKSAAQREAPRRQPGSLRAQSSNRNSKLVGRPPGVRKVQGKASCPSLWGPGAPGLPSAVGALHEAQASPAEDLSIHGLQPSTACVAGRPCRPPRAGLPGESRHTALAAAPRCAERSARVTTPQMRPQPPQMPRLPRLQSPEQVQHVSRPRVPPPACGRKAGAQHALSPSLDGASARAGRRSAPGHAAQQCSLAYRKSRSPGRVHLTLWAQTPGITPAGHGASPSARTACSDGEHATWHPGPGVCVDGAPACRRAGSWPRCARQAWCPRSRAKRPDPGARSPARPPARSCRSAAGSRQLTERICMAVQWGLAEPRRAGRAGWEAGPVAASQACACQGAWRGRVLLVLPAPPGACGPALRPQASSHAASFLCVSVGAGITRGVGPAIRGGAHRRGVKQQAVDDLVRQAGRGEERRLRLRAVRQRADREGLLGG